MIYDSDNSGFCPEPRAQSPEPGFTFSETAASRFDPVTTALGAGEGTRRGMVPEEISGRAAVPIEIPNTAASPAIPSPASCPVPRAPRPLRDISPDYREAQNRHMILRARAALRAQGLTPKAAARELGQAHGTLWRWAQRVAGLDLEDPKHLHDILERLCDRTNNCGRSSDYAPLLLIPSVQTKLREIHAATLGASSPSMTNDRRTGNYSATLKAFTLEPECPEPLKPKLLAGKFPVCLTRFLGQVTPEIEARLRGSKHFALNGPSGRREKLIGLPDGSRAYLPAGWVIELDDMSANQPFWVEGPDGPILSRQGLYVRCLKGGWRAVELISRPRESYTSADILRFLRRFCQLYGKPKKVRIERSVWAARNIAGFRLQGEDWIQEDVLRDEMGKEQRSDLENGLRALGIEIEYCHSARGKSDLEGAFHPFQTNLAIFTRDFINVGRHAGEFEHAAKKMRQVRAGSHHPKDLGFPHQSELLARIQKTFDYLNSLPRKGGSFDEIWTRDTTQWPLAALSSPRSASAKLMAAPSIPSSMVKPFASVRPKTSPASATATRCMSALMKPNPAWARPSTTARATTAATIKATPWANSSALPRTTSPAAPRTPIRYRTISRATASRNCTAPAPSPTKLPASSNSARASRALSALPSLVANPANPPPAPSKPAPPPACPSSPPAPSSSSRLCPRPQTPDPRARCVPPPPRNSAKATSAAGHKPPPPAPSWRHHHSPVWVRL